MRDRSGDRTAVDGLSSAAIQVVITVMLAGCQVAAGPEYQRPDVAKSSDGWSQLDGREISTTEVIQPDWWTGFGDAYLDSLIQQALYESTDVKIKALRLEAAGVRLGEAEYDRLPQITQTVKRSRTDTSESSSSATKTVDLNLSWEIDVWGKIKKQAQASNAAYLATEMDWRATNLTLVASVAEQYFGIRQFDEQIEQQTLAVEQAEELLKIYQAQFSEGLVPRTTVLNQEARISTLTSALLELQRNRDESELKLATLIGRQAGSLAVPVAPLRSTVDLLEVPNVLPSEMLARRPDVLEAEYRLLEAHHLVGRARLAAMPSFNLTGTISALTGAWALNLVENFSSMLDRDTGVDIELSEIERKQLVESYRKAVLTAFEEVEIALLNISAREQQMVELTKQISALRIVNRVQVARLKEGLVSQLEVFQTERDLLDAQQLVLSTYQQMLTDTVNLYKALGGGWPSERVSEGSVAAQ